MAFATITVTPTLSTDEYALGDVLFLNTVVPLPSRSCKLIDGYVVDFEGTKLTAEEITFYFFQKNAAEIGTINSTANISDANFRLNKFIGACKIETSTELESLTSVAIHQMVHYGQASDTSGVRPLNMALVSSGAEAPYDGNGAFPVFMSASISATTTVPNFTSADSLDIVLNFEY
tara:strand:- start:494 stop:1021 length:528 start_codon:yes stop_codon:yes gene_type:complete